MNEAPQPSLSGPPPYPDTEDGLRAARDELLPLLEPLPPDAPDTAARLVLLGVYSLDLAFRGERQSEVERLVDTGIVIQALERALVPLGGGPHAGRLRIALGEAFRLRHELLPDRPEDDLSLLDRADRALAEGLGGVHALLDTASGDGDGEGDDSGLRAECVTARHLLAANSLERYEVTQDTALLPQAIARHAAALPDHPEGSPEDVELRAAHGHLLTERALHHNDPSPLTAATESLEHAVRHAGPGPERAEYRFRLAWARYLRGEAGQGDTFYRAACAGYGEALAEDPPDPEAGPSYWQWDAHIGRLRIRARMVVGPDGGEHLAAAVRELAWCRETVPEFPEFEDPEWLADCAELLFMAAQHQVPGADPGWAVTLMRRAVERWDSEGDGPVWRARWRLVMLIDEYCRSRRSPAPGLLAEAVRLAAATAGDPAVPEADRRAAELLWALAHENFTRHIGPADDVGTPPAPPVRDPLRAVDAVLDALPPSPGGLDTVQQLYQLLLRADFAGTVLTGPRTRRLVGAITEPPPDDPPHRALAHTLAGLTLATSAQFRPQDQEINQESLRHLAEAERLGGAQGAIAPVQLAAEIQGARARGSREPITSLIEGRSPVSGIPGAVAETALRSEIAMRDALQRGDWPEAARHLADLRRAGDRLPGDSAERDYWQMITASYEGVLSAMSAASGSGGPYPDAVPAVLSSAADLRACLAGLPRGDREMWRLHGSLLLLTRAASGPPADLPAALDDLADLLAEARTDDEDGTGFLPALIESVVRYMRAEAEQGPRRDELIDTAIDGLNATLEALGGRHNPAWAPMCRLLATVRRRRGRSGPDGDRAASRRLALEGLRGYAWQAVLQSRPDLTAEAVREAGDLALRAAAWSVADGVPGEAVQALDAGRGLALHAAIVSGAVPDRLAAAGRPETAAEWRAAETSTGVPGISEDLRYRALRALTEPAAAGRLDAWLFDPPDPGAIGRALRTLGMDCLVYLVPAVPPEPGSAGTDALLGLARQFPGPPPQAGAGAAPLMGGLGAAAGAAVVVNADGRTDWLPLPGLTTDAGELRRYTRWSPDAARDLGPADDPPPAAEPGPELSATFRERLDAVTGWAWTAAMGPLLDALPGGEPPRLVLVPMGELSRVPWHAASRYVGAGRRRYAFHRAEISYAASARLFCEVASRTPAAHRGAALVVGNPTGDLRYAGQEAAAIHDTFYAATGGHYLGDGAEPATPQRLATWLSRGDITGAVLHLACHAGVTEHARDSACLVLHGGRLSAEQLTAVTSGSESSRGLLELVVLAACRSHVSGRGHNEAFSLATAFLVAGSGSVVGSLWPVPDGATSLLMFMFHHFLRAEGLRPGRALRRAQLWMLDPGRKVPVTMPPELADRVPAIDPDDLTAWASFTHLGR